MESFVLKIVSAHKTKSFDVTIQMNSLQLYFTSFLQKEIWKFCQILTFANFGSGLKTGKTENRAKEYNFMIAGF